MTVIEQFGDKHLSRLHKPFGWSSRGYVPHYDQPHLFQMITFRLYDSLPQAKIIELSDPSLKLDAIHLRKTLESYCDAGHGACYLRDSRIASVMQETLLIFDGERYRLLAWVVMPNHVHVLVQLDERFPLPEVLHSWKSYVANQANKVLGRSGPF